MQTFGYDLKRLKAIEGLEVLQDGNALIAISGPYQGRILTSSAKGMKGKSYGWVNYDLIESGKHATTMANLGGESRLWFGPEYGRFSLCFERGAEQIDDNMFRPHDSNYKKFKEIKRSKNSLTVGGQMQLKNAENYVFNIEVERTISLLTKAGIEKNLGISLAESTAFVGFSAESTVTNISQAPFQKENGLIAIWELGCMLTSPDNVVIIPLSQSTDSINSYFGEIEGRMQLKNDIVFYKVDALGINKIGIPPQYCKNVMGSYSPSNQLLNIVTFSFENDSLYVNSIPKNTAPYEGDVINIFNGVVDEKLDLPFYEFESSSSAKELKPNEKMYHWQRTYHFEGTEVELNVIAKRVLGGGLADIPKF